MNPSIINIFLCFNDWILLLGTPLPPPLAPTLGRLPLTWVDMGSPYKKLNQLKWSFPSFSEWHPPSLRLTLSKVQQNYWSGNRNLYHVPEDLINIQYLWFFQFLWVKLAWLQGNKLVPWKLWDHCIKYPQLLPNKNIAMQMAVYEIYWKLLPHHHFLPS